MFTGLVSGIGTVRSAQLAQDGRLKRLAIASPYDPATIEIGASIACSGVCLTAVRVEPAPEGALFHVEAAAETLARTSVADWQAATRINLERSLKVGDELGGHIVSGHVDGLAPILSREEMSAGDGPWGATARFWLRAPREVAAFVAQKGSVALDGTSLTVNEVEEDRFSVLLIPHTLAVTTWGERRAGDVVNIEIDLMARYAARLAQARAAGY